MKQHASYNNQQENKDRDRRINEIQYYQNEQENNEEYHEEFYDEFTDRRMNQVHSNNNKGLIEEYNILIDLYNQNGRDDCEEIEREINSLEENQLTQQFNNVYIILTRDASYHVYLYYNKVVKSFSSFQNHYLTKY